MNREDLQNLSRMRAREAKVLLDNAQYAGSYYLMGYALECAVKSAIAKKIARYEFPDKKLAQESYSHDLRSLMQTARIWEPFVLARNSSSTLELYWTVAKDWNETYRYALNVSETRARDLYGACTARTTGLLSWLKTYW
jgi:hypothetical protein